MKKHSELEDIMGKHSSAGIILGILFALIGILNIIYLKEGFYVFTGIIWISAGLISIVYHANRLVRVNRKKSKNKILLSSLIILLMLPMMSVSRVWASSQTSWEATLPNEDAFLNQTLTTYTNDGYAELGLSANLYVLQKDYPQSGQYELAMAVIGAANTRHTMRYSVMNYPWHQIGFQSGWKTLILGDDEGARIDIETSTYATHFFHYGGWYEKVFVTSNGFIVLDPKAYNDHGGKWTSPTPTSIPSEDGPDAIIAPFWRDLDPSKGGSIKYGIDNCIGDFTIAWIDVPNKANGKPQSFAVTLSRYSAAVQANIYFTYDSITNDVPTSIGIEDQTGKRGLQISSVSSQSKRVIIPDATEDGGCGYSIERIKISASKLTETGENDNHALIHIDGLNDTRPSGINVDLDEVTEGKYTSSPALATGKWILSAVAFASGSKLLGAVGFVLSTVDLLYEFSPMPRSSTVQEADPETQTAYVDALAKEEEGNYWQDWRPWDTAVYSLFRWRLLDASVIHRLKFTVEVTYWYLLTEAKYTLTSSPIELKLNPGSVSWYGRTNPDAHYYNFYQISTPYGTGYHIDSMGSNDYGYHMLGWSKLTDDAPEDYKVRPDGTIRVEGYFRQSDTFSSGDQPGRRLTNIYVMYSENLNKIAKTAQVLDYTDGTDWKHKSAVVSGLTPGKVVKIGVGRPDSWLADQNLVAEWAGINVYDGNSFRLSISASYGGTTDPAPGTYTYGYGTPVTVNASAYSHYAFDYWLLDGSTYYQNPKTVAMDSDHTLEAHFSFYNNPPSTPTLSGSQTVVRNVWYTYTTNAVMDPDGDSIRYHLNATGPGNPYQNTTIWVNSGTPMTWNLMWEPTDHPGTYLLQAWVEDSYGMLSSMGSLSVTMVDQPPNAPSQPLGPTICYVYSTSSYPYTSYSYTVSAVDPDGDNISYTFQFWTWPPTKMEGSITVGPYASGANATVSYVWTRPGRHCVAVYATDSYGLNSTYGYVTLVNVLQNDDGTGGDAGHTFANATVYSLAFDAGTLYPSLDNPEDWYQFYAQSGQRISAWLSSTGGANFDLQLYDNNTVLKASSTSTSSYDYINFIADSNGFWRIRIYNVTGEGLYYFGVSVYTPSPPGGCPILYTYNGTDYVCEGLLDIHNPEGIDVVYEYTLVTLPKRVNGAYLFRLVEHPQTISHIDQVKLYAILEDKSLVELPLIYAWHSEDGNVLPQLLFSDDWKTDELGANWNNGVSQSIDLKFAALNPNMKIIGFVFQIEGNNRIAKR